MHHIRKAGSARLSYVRKRGGRYSSHLQHHIAVLSEASFCPDGCGKPICTKLQEQADAYAQGKEIQVMVRSCRTRLTQAAA